MPSRPTLLLAALVAGGIAIHGPPFSAVARADPPVRTTSGLPLPRFVSVKSDRVMVRQGPGTEHRVLWVFTRAGLPVEIIQEWEGWRQIRDHEGAVGWVAQALLSPRRTAMVLAWERAEGAGDTRRPAPTAAVHSDRSGAPGRQIALLEAGVVVGIRTCDGTWCLITAGVHRGYIEQAKLWGVYRDETLR